LFVNPLDRWLGMFPEPTFIFGEPDRSNPDPGLFGPGSRTWQIHSDPASAVAGIRALLLQALHPQAMAGVAQWSDYREDPWGRLTRTAEYIGVTSFGTSEEAESAGEQVRRVHARLGVDQPELLMWVHAGFVDSLLHVYRLAHPRFTDSDADAYVQEQQTAARLVGLDVDSVFATERELAQYFEDVRPELGVIPEAMLAARMLVVPPMAPQVRWLTPAQGLWAVLAATAFNTLPLWAQQMYVEALGLPEAPTGLRPLIEASINNTRWLRDFGAMASVRGLRAMLMSLPEEVRTGAHLSAAQVRLDLASI
jgi:uncharacterized protein (DUF2236 family)